MSFKDRTAASPLAQPRKREASGAHFRRLGQAAPDVPKGLHASLVSEPPAELPCRFDVYRADEVRVTAMRFCGGDWHWRLSDASGALLVDAGGYANEDECRKAVLALKGQAALATLPGRAGSPICRPV